MSERPVVCERCGAGFGCGVEAGSCWCAEVAVGVETQRAIAAQYGDCLCPACLGALAYGEKPNSPPAPVIVERVEGRAGGGAA